VALPRFVPGPEELLPETEVLPPLLVELELTEMQMEVKLALLEESPTLPPDHPDSEGPSLSPEGPQAHQQEPGLEEPHRSSEELEVPRLGPEELLPYKGVPLPLGTQPEDNQT
jgi:hypothetical protein